MHTACLACEVFPFLFFLELDHGNQEQHSIALSCSLYAQLAYTTLSHTTSFCSAAHSMLSLHTPSTHTPKEGSRLACPKLSGLFTTSRRSSAGALTTQHMPHARFSPQCHLQAHTVSHNAKFQLMIPFLSSPCCSLGGIQKAQQWTPQMKKLGMSLHRSHGPSGGGRARPVGCFYRGPVCVYVRAHM
eukprot:1159411-Pelagomonas_calceolata.AAC.4